VSAERAGYNASISILIIIEILTTKMAAVMLAETGKSQHDLFPKARISVFVSYCTETDSFEKSNL
jgi:hypothetical protein